MTLPAGERDEIAVGYASLRDFAARLFTDRGVPADRAQLAAEALCYGDLCGFDSHGTFNLTRTYLPGLDSGRIDAAADPVVTTDLGACAAVDARSALGLWAAAEAMDDAAARARAHGIGLIALRGATHFGCAGFHALRAVEHGMIGLVAGNCGGQRLARPPGGSRALLGTNPLSLAAPARNRHPFVLDMSTTAVPTGKVRVAAADGAHIPVGWLQDDAGGDVTDPGAFDRGTAHLRWLGGVPESGAHKGFGLGLAVDLLAAGLSGAASGPAREALDGDGGPHGRDDDIGAVLLAIDPGRLRPDGDFAAAADEVLGTVLGCPPTGSAPIGYPGWWEAERALARRRSGVPLAARLHRELAGLGLDAHSGAVR
ncbi:Ldh family oxidoreductase [Saccharopolyspora sp. HNM0983]|uniref:Ldh family oxidoreductase n=1 Tax=Saccharopolyspora montiporae TaxID=2781240 RepID=A0A929B5Q7_9PSEU|nr:Ldh family oxidoreductase [Saccharopolyspora sp. HNM0983]MBE9373694.1 Ldh family oxidoreductase [Saccharopolyspora sp. HNM0983]